MTKISALSSSEYRLLDSGQGRKLEALGDYRIERQSPAAFWNRSLDSSQWSDLHAIHQRESTGGGYWDLLKNIPERFELSFGTIKLWVKLTPFGHVGFFAEQMEQWEWLRLAVQDLGADVKAMNLFAYTGGSSVAMAQGGAEVTHVDAARGIVEWARDNAALNQLPAKSIRWALEDCMAFIEKQQRREELYNAIVLDPPSFGRGQKKSEVFKIERDLPKLMEGAVQVLDFSRSGFVHFSCHTPGWSPLVLENLLRPYFSEERCGSIVVESNELSIAEVSGRRVPAGAYCRLKFSGVA